jgi:hypothetical protein
MKKTFAAVLLVLTAPLIAAPTATADPPPPPPDPVPSTPQPMPPQPNLNQGVGDPAHNICVITGHDC